MLAWLHCVIRRHHVPRRQVLGGFRCVECGAAGADLEEMGFPGSGWVRRIHDARMAARTQSRALGLFTNAGA